MADATSKPVAAAAAEVRCLDALGCLRPNTVLIHGVAMTTRDWDTVVAPGETLAASAGASPKLDRNFRPRSIVACVAWAVAASDALAIASGSPGAPELISFGSVGSH